MHSILSLTFFVRGLLIMPRRDGGSLLLWQSSCRHHGRRNYWNGLRIVNSYYEEVMSARRYIREARTNQLTLIMGGRGSIISGVWRVLHVVIASLVVIHFGRAYVRKKVRTRKMVNYAGIERSQRKLWWKLEAVLTCKSIV